MKLLYITSQKYPSGKVDPFFWQSMARAFTNALKADFLFLVRGDAPSELEGIRTFSIQAPRRLRTLFYFCFLPFLIVLRRWYSREVVFFSADAYLLAVLIFWRSILRFRYHICSDWHQLFDDWRDKYVAQNSDQLITTSQKLKNLLVSVCGVEQEKILVAYGGVDVTFFEKKRQKQKRTYRSELALPADTFLVSYIGAFHSLGLEKGLSTMLQALPLLPKGITMLFVGGSKGEIDMYKRHAENEKVFDRCIFVTKQSFERAVEYELASDALVIPYPDRHHFRNYGFPMKVWEYMASGRPIVYSNLDIIAEALQGRGVSFRPDEGKSLAEAVMFTYQNKKSVEEIAKRNTSDVVAYTWDVRARHIVNFIHADKK